jgi:hypothetical protein
MQNRYFDNRSTFAEPEVNQYGGSHPVMTNVMKPLKTKYVNLDTRFSNDTLLNNQLNNPKNSPYTANYLVDFPERIQNVRSIEAVTAEIPLSFYNISQYLQNTTMTLKFTGSGSPMTHVFTLPENKNYTFSDISSAFNSDTSINLYISLTSTNNKSVLTAKQNNTYTQVQILFDVDISGNIDPNNIKSKLGWLLGFRQPTYTINYSNSVDVLKTSEAFVDLNGPRYLYLAVDEFNNAAPQSTFVSMLPKSLLNRNILARISIDSYRYNLISSAGFGTIQTCTPTNGFLLSDKREYNDDVDLQKMRIQLVDEYGRTVGLNGLDFSFVLQVKHT